MVQQPLSLLVRIATCGQSALFECSCELIGRQCFHGLPRGNGAQNLGAQPALILHLVVVVLLLPRAGFVWVQAGRGLLLCPSRTQPSMKSSVFLASIARTSSGGSSKISASRITPFSKILSTSWRWDPLKSKSAGFQSDSSNIRDRPHLMRFMAEPGRASACPASVRTKVAACFLKRLVHALKPTKTRTGASSGHRFSTAVMIACSVSRLPAKECKQIFGGIGLNAFASCVKSRTNSPSACTLWTEIGLFNSAATRNCATNNGTWCSLKKNR